MRLDVKPAREPASAPPLLAWSCQPREMLLVLYPKALEDQVLGVLEQAGVPGYTEIPKTLGRGRRLRHFDTTAFPGTTGAIVTAVDAELAESLADSLARLDARMEARSHQLNGLHLFSWPCRQLI